MQLGARFLWGHTLLPSTSRTAKKPARHRHAPLCVAEKSRDEALSAALQKLRAKWTEKWSEGLLSEDGLLKRIATEAAEALEDISNPRTGLGRELLSSGSSELDTRPAVVRAREMILKDRAERKKTDDLFKKAGIPVLTLDPAALPTLPEMTAEERQANVASSSGATGSGPGVVPTTRVPKARLEDLNRAKWNMAVEEAYRSQLSKQQADIQGEIQKAEGGVKPPDMSDDEWASIVLRLKAVEQAIKEQNEQVRQLAILLQLAEQNGQLGSAAKEAAVASLLRGAEAAGIRAPDPSPSATGPGGVVPPSAVEQKTGRSIAVDSDVDKILSSALSELGLEGDNGPDRVVRVTGAELEDRIRQWASWDGVETQPPARGGGGGGAADSDDAANSG